MLYKKLFNQWHQDQTTQTLRQQQLSWFTEPVVIKQDQQLIDFITHNNIKKAIVYGDDYFCNFVEPVAQGPVDLVVWIQNKPFEFDQLVQQINSHIMADLRDQGIFYLAVNKFLCNQVKTHCDLPDNYNDALLQSFTQQVNADIDKYFLPDHVGSAFYWVHPLTRFYFKK